MLSKEKVKAFGKKIDDLIDWKKITGKAILGTAIEAVDNWLIPYTLDYLNEHFYDKLPDEYEAQVESMIEAFISDDYKGILDFIPGTIDTYIDVKAFNDDFEALWISTNWEALLKFIGYYASNKLKK